MEIKKEKILYSVQDVASVCGVSEAAVRMHVYRRSGFLPEPIRSGTKRLYWTWDQLNEHFRSMVPPASPPLSATKMGRPSKRQALARAQQESGK